MSRIENEILENEDSYFQKLQEDLDMIDQTLKRQEQEEQQFRIMQQQEVQMSKQLSQQIQETQQSTQDQQEQKSKGQIQATTKSPGKHFYSDALRPSSFSNLQSVVNPKQILEKKINKSNKELKINYQNGQKSEKFENGRSLSRKKDLQRSGQKSQQSRILNSSQQKRGQLLKQNTHQRIKKESNSQLYEADNNTQLLPTEQLSYQNTVSNYRIQNKSSANHNQTNLSNFGQNDRNMKANQILSSSMEDYTSQISEQAQLELLQQYNMYVDNQKNEREVENLNQDQNSEFNSFNTEDIIRNQFYQLNNQRQNLSQTQMHKKSYLQMFRNQSNEKPSQKSPTQKQQNQKQCSPARSQRQMLHSPQQPQVQPHSTYNSNRQSPYFYQKSESPSENQQQQETPQLQQKDFESIIANLHYQMQEAKQARDIAEEQLKKSQEDYQFLLESYRKDLEEKEQQNKNLTSKIDQIQQAFELQKQDIIQKAYQQFEQSMQNVLVEDIEILKNQNQAYETQIKILQENCKSIDQEWKSKYDQEVLQVQNLKNQLKILQESQGEESGRSQSSCLKCKQIEQAISQLQDQKKQFQKDLMQCVSFYIQREQVNIKEGMINCLKSELEKRGEECFQLQNKLELFNT